MDQQSNGQPPAELWARYEQQVVATDVAWQAYQKAAVQADATYQAYRDASANCEGAYLTWYQANEARNGSTTPTGRLTTGSPDRQDGFEGVARIHTLDLIQLAGLGIDFHITADLHSSISLFRGRTNRAQF